MAAYSVRSALQKEDSVATNDYALLRRVDGDSNWWVVTGEGAIRLCPELHFALNRVALLGWDAVCWVPEEGLVLVRAGTAGSLGGPVQ